MSQAIISHSLFCRRDALLAQDAEMEMAKRRKVSLSRICSHCGALTLRYLRLSE